METTDKYSCRILINLLVAHGIERVVLSPGSRNLPLLIAAERCPQLQCSVVIDERSAAFVALGMAAISGTPVAIICTSGTALLNYAPAVAEAYYRHIPLVVISADRPMQWIDQDDSQTIRQPGALSRIVKHYYDIPELTDSEQDRRYVERLVNDALMEMSQGCKGPVHINVQLAEPLNRLVEYQGNVLKRISMTSSQECLATSIAMDMAKVIAATPKVMIVAGFMSPNAHLSEALNQISRMPNVVILTETISNIGTDHSIECIDLAISNINQTLNPYEYAPDLLITMGGALVSRFVKQFLRTHKPADHWHVGHTHHTIDCMQALTDRICMEPENFFTSLAEHIKQVRHCTSDYSAKWRCMYMKSIARRDALLAACPWCDLKAFAYILANVPHSWNLQLSNGTPIRYAQLFADRIQVHRSDCNRGVSGIDGSTSTAIGASMAYSGQTLLITGDMSAQYDMGAFPIRQIPDRFKIIVINNHGGGIFRFIRSTAHVEEREMLFGTPVNFPVRAMAEAFDFAYFAAKDESSLANVFPCFLSSRSKAVLEITGLPDDNSASKLRELLLIQN